MQSPNHSENRTRLQESHLKIDSLEFNRRKSLFLATRQWATHKLACPYRATMETIPVSQWEYVSAYYSLSFQSSTLLGFIVASKRFQGSGQPRNRRRLHSQGNNQLRRGAPDRREMCTAVFVALLRTSVPSARRSVRSRNGGKMDLPLSASTIFDSEKIERAGIQHQGTVKSRIVQFMSRNVQGFPVSLR